MQGMVSQSSVTTDGLFLVKSSQRPLHGAFYPLSPQQYMIAADNKDHIIEGLLCARQGAEHTRTQRFPNFSPSNSTNPCMPSLVPPLSPTPERQREHKSIASNTARGIRKVPMKWRGHKVGHGQYFLRGPRE